MFWIFLNFEYLSCAATPTRCVAPPTHTAILLGGECVHDSLFYHGGGWRSWRCLTHWRSRSPPQPHRPADAESSGGVAFERVLRRLLSPKLGSSLQLERCAALSDSMLRRNGPNSLQGLCATRGLGQQQQDLRGLYMAHTLGPPHAHLTSLDR